MRRQNLCRNGGTGLLWGQTSRSAQVQRADREVCPNEMRYGTRERHEAMTYCLGIKTRGGLVLASDSRSNAGYDQVNVCRKMHTLVQEGERVFVLLTSGSLSLTQSIITL